MLLILGIVFVVLALLGLGGVLKGLGKLTWVLLVAAVLCIALSFFL